MTAAASAAVRAKDRRSLADRLYSLLVLAYPSELRDEFGEEMVLMFRAQRRAAGRNPLRRGRLWALALADVAVHALRERRDTRRARDDEGAAGLAHDGRAGGRAEIAPGGDPRGHGTGGIVARALRAAADDLRYAVRTLLRRPRFTALALVLLTIGVGTSAAVFGIVDATLLRPLPYAHAERLMDLWMHLPDGGFTVNAIPIESVRAWGEQRAIFDQVEGYDSASVVILGGGDPERAAAAWISPGLLPMLGVTPVRGRGFGPGDVAPGAQPAALISTGMWRRRFAAAPDVIGRELDLEGGSYTIVGVLPDSFRFPSAATAVWRAMPLAPHPDWKDSMTINAVGLLRPGVTAAQGQGLADAASQTLAELVESPWVKLRPWTELRAQPETRSSLLMLLGAVGFLVLIATANLANLLLAQTTARDGEIAVRAALGASRARVARQMFVESGVLAVLGGLSGLLLAGALLRLTLTRVPASIVYRLADRIAVDGRVALFALAVSLTVGLLMGLLPALGCARRASSLPGARGSSASRRHARVRKVLVVAEVGLSLLLLVGAGLMANSFARLQSIDPGFDPENLLLVQLQLDNTRYPTEGERIRLTDELDALIEELPGVAGSTVGGDAPPVPGGTSVGIAPEAEGMPAAPMEMPVMPYGRVAPDYFEVVDIPLLAGTTFSDPATAAGPTVVINETVAEHFWGDVNPVGRRFRLDPDAEWRTVVGVVRDVRAGSPDDPYGSMEIYYPFDPEHRGPAFRTLAVRTEGDPLALVEAIKSLVWSLDAEQPVAFQRATDVLAGRVEVPRFYLQLIGAFALIAAVLAALGLYGVLSYSVGQRLREIGIRMALGESEGGILRRVVRGGLMPAAIGVAIGLAGASVLSRYLESLLYQVSPVDPLTFAVTGGLMLLIAAAACYFPARRATRVDPVKALRAE